MTSGGFATSVSPIVPSLLIGRNFYFKKLDVFDCQDFQKCCRFGSRTVDRLIHVLFCLLRCVVVVFLLRFFGALTLCIIRPGVATYFLRVLLFFCVFFCEITTANFLLLCLCENLQVLVFSFARVLQCFWFVFTCV